MKELISIALLTASAFCAQVAIAADAPSGCEAKAFSKEGKPLNGAAKSSSIKKCEADTLSTSGCEGKAIDKNGKKLGGAAKTSFMKKCIADFQTGK